MAMVAASIIHYLWVGLVHNVTIAILRLLTALEMAEHSEFYDTSSPKYKDLIKESAVVNDPYYNLLRAAYKSDGWS